MDWTTGIQNAINYVEEHLCEEIDYEAVAGQAASSSFYFQKIFHSLCGISLGEYIRCRRLALAGSELKSGRYKVIDVALKYGYESPESFSRAFSKFHGVSPSMAKKESAKLRSFSRISLKLIINGGNSMEYKIIKKEAFDVVEKAEIHSLDNGENTRTIPDFWSRARKDGTIEKLLELTSDQKFLFGICYGNGKESPKTFEYAIGAVCGEETMVPEGFRKTTIPARTWAVFECTGAMPEAIQEKWNEIVTTFFPTSGYVPTYEMDIEAYTDGDMSCPDYKSEIWVPVIQKQ